MASEPPVLAPTSQSSSTTASAPWFHRVTFFGFLAGLCPLIPIPFLDDQVLAWVRRRMVREVLAGGGLSFDDSEIRVLAGEKSNGFLSGCVGSLFLLPLVKITVYLVRKVVRKILLILTLKECSDRFSETLHEGYLLHRAVQDGLLAAGPQDHVAGIGGLGETARRPVELLRLAIGQACREVDPRPVHQLIKQAFRGSRFLLVRAARVLAGGYRRFRVSRGEAVEEALLEEEGNLLGSLQTSLGTSLWTQQAYWARLEEIFGQAWAAAASPDPAEVAGPSEAPAKVPPTGAPSVTDRS